VSHTTGHDAPPLAPAFDRVRVFSSVEAEYGAFRAGAALVDRSDRARFVFSGSKAGETLSGLVTNDVLALTPGLGQYAAALTAKGKIITDLRIFARAADFLLDTPGEAAPGFAAMLRKFVNPRFARWEEVSASLRAVGVYGPVARRALATALEVSDDALAALAPFAHLNARTEGVPLLVVRSPDFGVEGFDVVVPVEAARPLWDRLHGAGATPAGTDAADILRVEAGQPRWGVDMDESTLAQEANLEALDAISFTKGCYTGQETVVRVHFRGHVNRSLRGLTSSAPL